MPIHGPHRGYAKPTTPKSISEDKNFIKQFKQAQGEKSKYDGVSLIDIARDAAKQFNLTGLTGAKPKQ